MAIWWDIIEECLSFYLLEFLGFWGVILSVGFSRRRGRSYGLFFHLDWHSQICPFAFIPFQVFFFWWPLFVLGVIFVLIGDGFFLMIFCVNFITFFFIIELYVVAWEWLITAFTILLGFFCGIFGQCHFSFYVFFYLDSNSCCFCAKK